MIDIIVTGAYGRMGHRLAECIVEDPQLHLAGLTEHPEHPQLGTPVCGVEVCTDLKEIIDKGLVIIDFTTPQASVNAAQLAVAHQKAFICGTTGFSPEQLSVLKHAGSKIPVVYSPNMSVGVNLLFKLVADVASLLNEGYDVEIVEAHHRYKKDAPSGTAQRLADIIADTWNLDPKQAFEYGREGLTGERKDHIIGVHAVRGGDIVGEHTVSFIGLGERLELTHKAHSRDTFIRGALSAAKWIVNQPAGFYTMHDILSS
ncbi:MAG: 4-hydroxy-tetrahydrodipicolinate reductase [Gemmatimonadetes bacterium]|nr:MAG: 4-hydroxy-tetrahydrodipicolinate reductase [Gemmatimonadota bacterium]